MGHHLKPVLETGVCYCIPHITPRIDSVYLDIVSKEGYVCSAIKLHKDETITIDHKPHLNYDGRFKNYTVDMHFPHKLIFFADEFGHIENLISKVHTVAPHYWSFHLFDEDQWKVVISFQKEEDAVMFKMVCS